MLPDIRRFEISSKDMQNVLHAFGLGTLKSYHTEKDISYHHSNKIILAETTENKRYACKFYLTSQRALRFYAEFLIVNKLLNKNFKTCRMYLTTDSKPFCKIRCYNVTVYDWLDGSSLIHLHFKKEDIAKLIRLLSDTRKQLREIDENERISKYLLKDFEKKYNLRVLEKSLYNEEKSNLIDVVHNIGNILNENGSKEKKGLVHSGITLTNIVCMNNELFLIDFNHATYDYFLKECASFIVSLLSEKYPKCTIENFLKEYQRANNLYNLNMQFLYALVAFELLNDYSRFMERLSKVINSKKMPKEAKGLDKKKLIKEERDYLSYLKRVISYLDLKLKK